MVPLLGGGGIFSGKRRLKLVFGSTRNTRDLSCRAVKAAEDNLTQIEFLLELEKPAAELSARVLTLTPYFMDDRATPKMVTALVA